MNYTYNLNSYVRQSSIIKYCVTKVMLSFVILLLGGLIYIIYRDKSLLMFDWFDAIGIGDAINGLRRLFQGEGIYGWVKYSLPDGLWLFSYLFLVDTIWDGERNAISILFLWGLPVVAVISECLQYCSLLPGVFDWVDLVCYLLAITLFMIVKPLN